MELSVLQIRKLHAGDAVLVLELIELVLELGQRSERNALGKIIRRLRHETELWL